MIYMFVYFFFFFFYTIAFLYAKTIEIKKILTILDILNHVKYGILFICAN